MRVYLASPKSTTHAEGMVGRDVLLSFGEWGPYLEPYVCAFRHVLIDSGAYKEFTTGKRIELSAYADWAEGWGGRADAIAGLDDIAGDWRRSLANYEAFPLGFPTFHWTDPEALLPDLVAMARERGQWLGIGMCGQQKQREREREEWLRRTLGRIPEGTHVHGWALGAYCDHRRLDSYDSTKWMGLAADLAGHHVTRYLTLRERIGVAAAYLERRALDRRQGARGPAFRRSSEPDLFGEEGDG